MILAKPFPRLVVLLAMCLASMAAEPATQPKVSRLVIQTSGLRNRDGQLVFGVFRSSAGFPNVQKRSINWQVKPATGDGVFVVDLPPGVYAASILHDENNSGDMERNLAGVPKEGYGVTNNPKPKLRAATFKEATFTLPAEGATLTIDMQYTFF